MISYEEVVQLPAFNRKTLVLIGKILKSIIRELLVSQSPFVLVSKQFDYVTEDLTDESSCLMGNVFARFRCARCRKETYQKCTPDQIPR